MANITISDLRPAGANLFSDSESHLRDLTEQEMMDTLGGVTIAEIGIVLAIGAILLTKLILTNIFFYDTMMRKHFLPQPKC